MAEWPKGKLCESEVGVIAEIALILLSQLDLITGLHDGWLHTPNVLQNVAQHSIDTGDNQPVTG